MNDLTIDWYFLKYSIWFCSCLWWLQLWNVAYQVNESNSLEPKIENVFLLNLRDGVMVSVPDWSGVDRGLKHHLGQSKDY